MGKGRLMGCDVHSIGQVKINNQWETKIADIADSPRDYNSFAIMACIRGRTKWSIESRGLPVDIEVDTNNYMKLDPDEVKYSDYGERCGYWLGDHSHSHFTLQEITALFSIVSSKLYKKFNKPDRELAEAKRGYLGDVIKCLKQLKKQYKVKDDEVRIVFGFDS